MYHNKNNQNFQKNKFKMNFQNWNRNNNNKIKIYFQEWIRKKKQQKWKF